MTSRSERVVGVLNETDPQFSALCDLLYGPGVDADAIWADVYGNEPIAKLSERGKHVAESVGLGATLIGSGLGVKELAEQAGRIGAEGNKIQRASEAVGRLVPTKISGPKTRTALAATMLGGDAAATAALADSHKQRKNTQGQLVAKNLVTDAAEQVVSRGRRGEAMMLGDAPQGAINPKSLAGRLAASRATTPSPAGIINEAAQHADGLVTGADRAEQMAAKLVRGRARPIHSAKQLPGKAVGAIKANPGKSALIGAAGVGTGAVVHDMRQPRLQEQEMIKRLAAPTDEFEATGTFSKFDEDKRLAFGWASVVSKNGIPVIDRQGDYMTIDDVEDAAYRYVISSRIGGDMHKRNGEQPHHVSDLVESMVFTKEKIAKMGLPKDFPEAWWVGFKVHDDDTWNLVKSDKRSGFSIHGRGKRALHEMDDAMDYR